MSRSFPRYQGKRTRDRKELRTLDKQRRADTREFRQAARRLVSWSAAR